MPFVLMHLGHTTGGPAFTVIFGAFLLVLGVAVILRGRYE
jgi:hypothetical protein